MPETPSQRLAREVNECSHQKDIIALLALMVQKADPAAWMDMTLQQKVHATNTYRLAWKTIRHGLDGIVLPD